MPGGVVRSSASVRGGSAGVPDDDRLAATAAVTRGRAGLGVVGTAVPRPPGTGGGSYYVSHPFYGPWGYWYPWFGPGFGWYVGYVGYNPYWYASTYWGFGRYGYWYDPFYYGGGYGGGYESSGSGGGYSEPKSTIGSIRLKVNPGTAKVYVDGVLYGEAQEFGGLKNHLELDGGAWTLELRADGYETVHHKIRVEIGRTLTERVTLKKK